MLVVELISLETANAGYVPTQALDKDVMAEAVHRFKTARESVCGFQRHYIDHRRNSSRFRDRNYSRLRRSRDAVNTYREVLTTARILF